MLKLVLLIFCLGFYCPLFSQCKNSIEVKRSSTEAGRQNKGILEIEIGSSAGYVCYLYIEKGTGPEQIQKRDGHGNSLVHFEGLDTTQTYMVEVVFASEDKPHCKKLQRSQIIIDSE